MGGWHGAGWAGGTENTPFSLPSHHRPSPLHCTPSDPATTQKTRSIVEYELESAAKAGLGPGGAACTRLRMAGASLSENAASDDLCGGILTVQWSEGSESTFDGRWLRVLSSLPPSSAAAPPATPWTDSASPLSTALGSSTPVPTATYEDVMGAEEPIFAWTHELVRSGLCVITGVPQEPGVVTEVASRVAPVLPTLYGTSFDVRVEGQPINIAYTDRALRPHQDLPYYESPPGLQFLHCIQFDETVAGGDSVFYDTFVLAQLLRERDPDAFETLCTVPATFQKNHLNREQPAQMFYRRPIISVNSQKDVVGVFWSPAFEVRPHHHHARTRADNPSPHTHLTTPRLNPTGPARPRWATA